MRIGVISEGHADRAVIVNILTGLLEIDSENIEALRPMDKFDKTDKSFIDPKRFGGWTSVKEECETRKLIDQFLAIEGQDFVVIHLDTAEAEEYGVVRPAKDSQYCEILRKRVIDKINSWLKEDLDSILYAIAIEEIDAWILTVYDSGDSTRTAKAKEKLGKVLGKIGINSTSNYENYLSISKSLSKPKEIRKGKYLEHNCSLHAFFEEIQTKAISKA